MKTKNQRMKKMSNNDFVDAIIAGNNIEAEKSFKNTISSKVGDALEAKRKIYAINAVIKNKFKSEGNLTDTVVPKKFCKDLKQKLHQVNIDYEYFNKNFIKIVNNSDDLFLDSGALIHYALAEKAKKIGAKVILTGVGGDEIFGGYSWQARLKSINRFNLKKP